MQNEILNVREFTEKTGRSLSIAIENAISRHQADNKTLPNTLLITQQQLSLLRKARNTTSYLATLKPDSNLYMFYAPQAALEVLIDGLVVETREDFRDGLITPNIIMVDDGQPTYEELDKTNAGQ